MRNRSKINTLQLYYEMKITDNMTKEKDRLTSGIILGLRLALSNFAYTPDQLDNMEYIYNELMDLKKEI